MIAIWSPPWSSWASTRPVLAAVRQLQALRANGADQQDQHRPDRSAAAVVVLGERPAPPSASRPRASTAPISS